MTLKEAADFYRGSVSLLEKLEHISEAIDLDRSARQALVASALDTAKAFERVMEAELHKAAGGRYWDPVEARMCRAYTPQPVQAEPRKCRIQERVVECRTSNGRCIYPSKSPCEGHGGCLGG